MLSSNFEFQVDGQGDRAIIKASEPMLIPLSMRQPFAGGCKRDCYIHPFDPDQIIKVIPPHKSIQLLHSQKLWIRRVLQTPESMDANRGEHEKFEKLSKNYGDLRTAFPYLVEYYGKVQTDMGEGLVFQAIKNFDGTISQTVKAAGETGGYNKAKLLEAVKKMASNRNDGLIYHDVGKGNIVVQQLAPDHQEYKLWVIDGINNRALIPIAEYSGIYASVRKAKKIWKLNRYIHKNFKAV